LHARSRRCREPFVVVHCAALPDNLLEAELFGHAKGAFTGAFQARAGLVRSAERGVLFLDEIDSLSLGAQAKLLRFLETGEFRAVGADQTEKSDTWVIVATNQDLRHCVQSRLFREDLLYRLEVVRIDVPPLCQRREDIMALATHFLGEVGCQHKRFTPAAYRRIETHDWPGNVRELRHRVESAALLSDTMEIGEEDLGLPSVVEPAAAAATGSERTVQATLWRMLEERGMTLAQATAACEEMLVSAALEAELNNRTRAAARLGIHVRTIYKKLLPAPAGVKDQRGAAGEAGERAIGAREIAERDLVAFAATDRPRIEDAQASAAGGAVADHAGHHDDVQAG
jgi:DNA-binding NtrC family response regulator